MMMTMTPTTTRRSATNFSVTPQSGWLLLPLLLLATFPSFTHSVDPSSKYVVCPGSSTHLNPIVLQGKRFFDSVTGDYFPVKGMAYYPRPNAGPLSGLEVNSVDFFTANWQHLWEKDIAWLQQLGINVIRIYAVDPSQNHDAFMCALEAAGIYAMIGLLADCENCGIGPDEAPSCYPTALKERGQWIINEFSKYRNTLAFSAGNEVTLYARDRNIELNAPCQKKFIHDMRLYQETCHDIPSSILPRIVPVGMVNWDVERELQTLYFNCITSSSLETPAWYGLNAYQHCDGTDPTLPGWQQLLQDFTSYNLPVPVVMAEYGCRERSFPTLGEFEAQRDWLQVDALYSQEYAQQFAGGVVFEYSAEKSVVDTANQGNPWPYNGFMKIQYGVGYYAPVDCNHDDVPCEYNPYPEFDLLQTKLAAVNGNDMPSLEDYKSTLQTIPPPDCPADFASSIDDYDWPTDASPDLPCYQVATEAPSQQPSESPTMAPTITPAPTSSSNDENAASSSAAPTRHHCSWILVVASMFWTVSWRLMVGA